MTKQQIINKAIETQDCILMDGETIVPVDLSGSKLSYYDQEFQMYTQNIENVEIEENL